MKILNCRIENFGALSGFYIDFKDGLNTFRAENGRGKSTLAAFIRVMLFGFENETKRSELDNERRRYNPWQGGAYGGRLEFETGGRRYIVERFFGVKERDDSFSLLDAETLLPSSDFSPNLGEELFQIDSASFRRTVFISQNDIETSSTDGIIAKISGLARCGDDIDNFERVDKRLADKLNELSPRRKTGSIAKLKEETAALEASVRDGENLERELLSLTEEHTSLRRRMTELRGEQTELLERRRRLALQRELMAKKQRLDSLRAEEKRRLEALGSAREALPDALPSRDELRRLQNENSRLASLRAEELALRLSDAEEERLGSLKDILDKTVERDADEKIELWYVRSELLGLIPSFEKELAEKNSAEKTAVSVSRLTVSGVMLGLVCLCLGLTVLSGWTSVAAATVGAAAGLACLVFAVAQRKRIAAIEAEISTLKEKIEENRNKAIDIESEVSSFLQSRRSGGEADTLASLYELRSAVSEGRALSEKLEKHKSAQRSADEAQAKLEEGLSALELPAGGDAATLLADTLEKLRIYENCLAESDKAKNERAAFEKNEDIDLISRAEAPAPDEAQAVEDALSKAAAEEEELRAEASRAERRMDELRDAQGRVLSDERQLSLNRAALEEELKNYSILEKTRELLTKAKESLSARYMGPILAGFSKYHAMLSGGKNAAFSLDANLRLLADEAGKLRDPRFLSAGRRDLVGLCLRLALVDAMYPGEKPFIILDDPFVNLDDAAAGGGLNLLKSLSEEYQVIYFTCHESRMI